jgi:hypothetical protein
MILLLIGRSSNYWFESLKLYFFFIGLDHLNDILSTYSVQPHNMPLLRVLLVVGTINRLVLAAAASRTYRAKAKRHSRRVIYHSTVARPDYERQYVREATAARTRRLIVRILAVSF